MSEPLKSETDRANFLLKRKNELMRQRWLLIDLLGECSPHVPEGTRVKILAYFDKIHGEDPNGTYIWHENDSVELRRIQ